MAVPPLATGGQGFCVKINVRDRLLCSRRSETFEQPLNSIHDEAL